MTTSRRQLMTIALYRSRLFAIFLLLVLLGWTGQGMALTPAPGAIIVNRATTQFSDDRGNSLPKLAASVQVPIAAGPHLQLIESVNADLILPGTELIYTLRYGNNGNADAHNVRIVDILPAGLILQTTTPQGADAPGGTITWDLGTLPPGAQGMITVTLLVPPGTPFGSTFTNRATITAGEGYAEATPLTITIGRGSNLVLSKAGSPDKVMPNGIIAYKLSYQNRGNQAANFVLLTDQIPSGTAYVANSATPAATLSNGMLTWILGAVAPQEQGEVSFQVRVSGIAKEGDRITNLAGMASQEQAIVSNALVTPVVALPLIVLKKDAPATSRAGLDIIYSMQLENTGTTPLTNVVLHDPLPAGTSFVAADGGGVLLTGGNRVAWDIATLDVGSKRTVTLTLRTDPTLGEGIVIENAATIASDELPPQTAKAITTLKARTPGVIKFFNAAGEPAYGYMGGATIYIQVQDLDQNVDPSAVETVVIVISHPPSGDQETVLLTETGPNTGIFRGSIVSKKAATAVSGDGTLNVSANSRITATYSDPLDAAAVSDASALIDPLGIVFDSSTGTAIAGTVVTLRTWNSVTNSCDKTFLPVLPPDQINPAPPTGTDGKFAFPLVPAGDYCFEVTPSPGYSFPSTVSDAELPGGFTIGNGSRGEKFTLSIGDPPLVRDIPLDAPAGTLKIAKTANKTAAAVGDTVRYSLKLTNEGGSPVTQLLVTDIMPHGISYIADSSRLNGEALANPQNRGNRTLAWGIPRLAPGENLEITYQAVIGPDSPRGNGINTVSAAGINLSRPVASNTARVAVSISGGIFTENGTILGKIFLDRDGNRVQNQGKTEDGNSDEPGIPQVVIYLEDGTRVITDKNGKFSLAGILPGTHVLRVDETSLPHGLTLVPLSNRFMGDGASQFVTMSAGGLLVADFAVRPQETETTDKVTAPPEDKDNILFPAPADVAAPSPVLPTTNPEEKESPVATAPETSTRREAEAGQVGKEPAEPTVSVDSKEQNPPSLPSSSQAAEPSATPPLPAVSAETSSERRQGRNWEEEIKNLSPALDFLTPMDGSAVMRNQIRVVFKTPFGTAPSLSLNGEAISAKQLGRKIEYEKGGVTIYEYIDIHLNAGVKNTLTAEVADTFGIVRGTKQITILAAGPPERIVIKPEQAEAPADGKSRIKVTVSLRDKLDQIVPYAAAVSISLSAGEIVEMNAAPPGEDFQIALHNGVGQFTILAPRETGEGIITVSLDSHQETAKVFFTPNLRDLFLVGMGELTIGHGKTSGDYGFLRDKSWFKEGIYSGGRAAFFSKGKIYNDYLLTAAYDSDKAKRDDLFREKDMNLDTEDKYPIYGDESKTGYEALSTERLYLKVEKNRSSLLYGDFRTDLTDTRLAAYNRAFTGLKYELNTEKFKVRSFATHTDQTQVVDTLSGKGISGNYYLTKRPVVEGSERVVIETRDRFRPDQVLKRENKGRGSDYELDYDLGALLFKGPVPSFDADYNPVFIIVSYESKTAGDKYYVYGGRAAFQVRDWLEIGGTGVTEERALGNSQLAGTDLTMTLPGKTILKAEYAATRSTLEEAGIFNWHSDQGWYFNMESDPLNKLHLNGYYRTLGDYFLNPSAVDVSRGTTKYGIEGIYLLRPETKLHAQYFDEQDDLNSMQHRLVSLAAQTKFNKTKLEMALANESSSESYTPVPDTVNRSPFDVTKDIPHELSTLKFAMETELNPDLALTASHKQNLTHDSYSMSQAGVNYRLTNASRLYAREEYLKYQERGETRTLLGVESEIIKNTVAYDEYRLADSADGSRNQQVLGLRNKFFLSKDFSGNIAAEYLKTLSGTERDVEPDALAASLGLEYLAQQNTKITSRFEHRRELKDDGRRSYMGEVGMAYRLNPDYSLLLRERYFFEEAGSAGKHTTSRVMAGIAYRPQLNNRYAMLAKLEHKYEDNTGATPAFRDIAYILSTEGVYQATPRLQLMGKYAGKLVQGDAPSSYTDLISTRMVYDLNDRWDMGLEYRVLTSYLGGNRYQGGAIELGRRVLEMLWISGGYSFDKFDADLAGDSYRGQGPYLKLRIKFDEHTVKQSSRTARRFMEKL